MIEKKGLPESEEAKNVGNVQVSPEVPSYGTMRHIPVSSKPIYLIRRFSTTRESIDSLGPLERSVCEYLVKIGDITIENPKEA